jgi:hypothetical protein
MCFPSSRASAAPAQLLGAAPQLPKLWHATASRQHAHVLFEIFCSVVQISISSSERWCRGGHRAHELQWAQRRLAAAGTLVAAQNRLHARKLRMLGMLLLLLIRRRWCAVERDELLDSELVSIHSPCILVPCFQHPCHRSVHARAASALLRVSLPL